ncbi:MAG: biotin carboxylase N-terminal domain-containing protein [Bermanella sp.]
MAQLFNKILIANRGEVAVRIILACQKLHIATVAVYSDADKHSPYVNMADEAIHIGDSRAAESYLNQDKILQAARLTGSDAIHPGFGFLSENPGFAKNCITAGIHFIGPSADNMLLMSSKSASKELVASLDLPIIPGLANPPQDSASLSQAATDIGYPVLIKASAGGGGMGMRVVNAKDEFENALAATKQEAKNSFGDDHVLVEKYFKRVRHIEVQLLCDQHGKALHCYERECSIQRRRQKVVEEAPAASISENLREKICQASVKIAQAVNYQGLGTVEFMVEEGTDNFYFLEMNTRLQVEHGISEKITGLDLVVLQIEIAQGQALSLRQEDIKIIGHAIECRLYAEDPQQNFIPSVGTVLHWSPFSGEGIRSDAGIASGSQVSSFYDPMLAKLISFGKDRPTAIRAMNRHLENTQLLGITTNQSFLKIVLKHPDFLMGKTNTDFIEHNIQSLTPSLTKQDVNKLLLVAVAQRALAEEIGLVNHLPSTRHFQLALNDHSYGLFVSHNGQDGYDVKLEEENFEIEILKHDLKNGVGEILLAIEGHSERYTYAIDKNALFVHSNKIAAHKVSYVSRFSNSNLQTDGAGYQAAMPGRIIEVLVNSGDSVKEGDKLLTMESMKMEHSTFAKSDGRVAELFVAEGNLVNKGDTLIDIQEQ